VPIVSAHFLSFVLYCTIGNFWNVIGWCKLCTGYIDLLVKIRSAVLESGGRNLPFPVTVAIGFCNCLFCRTSREKKQQGKEFVYKLLVQFGRADRPIFSAGASGKGVGKGGLPPIEKLPPWATAWEILLPSFLCIHCWNGCVRREHP